MSLNQNFTATMTAAKANSHFANFDATIKAEIDEYNIRFSSTPGFTKLDWKIFKAVVLIESGGPANPAWSKRAMQIGNVGDPALGVLKRQEEGSSIIMSTQLKGDIKSKSIDDPFLNVRAGIAYILTKAVTLSPNMQIDDPAVHTHKVRAGESLSVIARREHTTIQDLQATNPTTGATIHQGDLLKFHHSHMTSAISGWSAIDAAFLQNKYNGGGDPEYADKISYVLSIL